MRFFSFFRVFPVFSVLPRSPGLPASLGLPVPLCACLCFPVPPCPPPSLPSVFRFFNGLLTSSHPFPSFIVSGGSRVAFLIAPGRVWITFPRSLANGLGSFRDDLCRVYSIYFASISSISTFRIAARHIFVSVVLDGFTLHFPHHKFCR